MPIARARHIAVLAVLSAAALLTSGCTGDTSAPASSHTQSPTPTTTASMSASPAPASPPATSDAAFAARVPGACDQLATDATRQSTVGTMRLQSDGVGFVRPAPDGAELALGCDWFEGDSSGVLLLISTAAPDAVTAAVGTLPGRGYTCQVSDDFGAQFCVKPGQGENTEEMIVARADVWIYLSTARVNGRAFLSEIASQIYG